MAVPESITLLKLGGSLITDKARSESLRRDVLARIAGEIAAARRAGKAGRLVLAHGSGSFGHAAAAGTPLEKRAASDASKDGPALLTAIARTQDAAARLHREVISAFLSAGVEVFSLVPSSWFSSDRGEVCSLHLQPLLGALDSCLVPVVYGDVVIDRRWGARIASTEEILAQLVRALRARRLSPRLALWFGSTPGLLDADGNLITSVGEDNLAEALQAAGGAAGVDVTGGMRLRLETAWDLARLGVRSVIADGRVPGALERALRGEIQGTEVTAREG